MIKRWRLANLSNGIVFPHDMVCWFQSNHAHNRSTGYFDQAAMPWPAVVNMFARPEDQYLILDATRRHKPLTDAQKVGVPTWCLTFNHALGLPYEQVCVWETREMREAAADPIHHDLRQQIRRLSRYFEPRKQGLVLGRDVFVECYQNAEWDDKPKRIRERLLEPLPQEVSIPSPS